MKELELQLLGYRLTTAEIIYHLPDYPCVLQTFVWQTLDIAPDFPRLQRFIAYWKQYLDGKVHSVRVASAELVKPAEFRLVGNEFRLH